jgi:hypothetical protein
MSQFQQKLTELFDYEPITLQSHIPQLKPRTGKYFCGTPKKCDRRSVGWFDKGKPHIPLKFISTDDEVYESDLFRFYKKPF